MTAHGTSIKSAIHDLEFKLLENHNITEHIVRIKSQGYVTPMDYRLITRACETGTEEFLKRKHLSWDDRRTIEEIIELTKDEYGHETFTEVMKKYNCIS